MFEKQIVVLLKTIMPLLIPSTYSYSLEEDNIDNGDRRDDDYLSGGVEGGVGASVDTPTN